MHEGRPLYMIRSLLRGEKPTVHSTYNLRAHEESWAERELGVDSAGAALRGEVRSSIDGGSAGGLVALRIAEA